MSKLKINATIVVEGRDDAANLCKVCEANFIITHGLHISAATYAELELAARTSGIIIFTDPDGPGREIRSKIERYFDKRKNDCDYNISHAFIFADEARSDKDIGVENAGAESLLRALNSLKSDKGMPPIYTELDLDYYSLSGGGSKKLRESLCKELNLGYANSKMLIKKLNSYSIPRRELEAALDKIRSEKI